MRASGNTCSSSRPQPQILLLVDRDDQHRIRRIQQLLRQQQARAPSSPATCCGDTGRRPRRNRCCISSPSPRVVGRVDVDGVHLAPMRPGQGFQHVVVLAVDDRVPRLVAAARDSCRWRQGPDRWCRGIPRRRPGRLTDVCALLCGCVEQFQFGSFPVAVLDDSFSPATAAGRLGSRAARRQHAHLVAPAHRALRQFHRFRPVALEVQAKGQPRRQRLELALQVGAELRVFGLGLAQSDQSIGTRQLLFDASRNSNPDLLISVPPGADPTTPPNVSYCFYDDAACCGEWPSSAVWIRTRKFPLPHAGSKKRESIRSVSPLTRSSIASTIHAGVNTSPWSATRCFDLNRLMGKSAVHGAFAGRRARPCGVHSIATVARHSGNRLQPKNERPAFAPRFASRLTIGLPQRGHSR